MHGTGPYKISSPILLHTHEALTGTQLLSDICTLSFPNYSAAQHHSCPSGLLGTTASLARILGISAPSGLPSVFLVWVFCCHSYADPSAPKVAGYFVWIGRRRGRMKSSIWDIKRRAQHGENPENTAKVKVPHKTLDNLPPKTNKRSILPVGTASVPVQITSWTKSLAH